MVQLDSLVTGAAIEPGDPVIGLPSSGLHSNGYTLARSALSEIPLDDDRLGRPLGDVLLEPTEIYVKPVVELLRSDIEVCGLAHITSGGLNNLLRLEADVAYEIDDPLPVPPIFELIQELGDVRTRRCMRSSTWAAASVSSLPPTTRMPPWTLFELPTMKRSGSDGRLPALRTSDERDHEENRSCPGRGGLRDRDLRLIESGEEGS